MMNDFRITRRGFGFLAAGAAAAAMLPLPTWAAGGTAVAATFPGSWEDAYRTVLTPMVQKAGYDLTIAPALAQDQLAKIMASPGHPPYDTLLMSPGQMAVAIENDLIQAIKTVAEGKTFFSPEISRMLAEEYVREIKSREFEAR